MNDRLTDAEMRTEGRRLLAEWRDAVDTLHDAGGDLQGVDWVEDVDTNLADFFYRNADVLLADPECACDIDVCHRCGAELEDSAVPTSRRPRRPIDPDDPDWWGRAG